MRIGTKSVLYGAHQCLIHPWFVALGWWKLYGFPWDPRLWVAFFVHDLGYWGKPNMDGKEGEEHIYWGARFVYRCFGLDWWKLCMYHSRYWAKAHGEPPSRLCYADKLAFVLTPKWLYLGLVWMTGEWREYASAHMHEVRPNYTRAGGYSGMREWYLVSREYVRKWVDTHKDGRQDTWTKTKQQVVSTGLSNG